MQHAYAANTLPASSHPIRDPSQLVVALDAQQKALAAAHDLTHRIDAALDRLSGPTPQSVAGSDPKASRVGLLGQLADAQEGLDAIVRRLGDIADRIDRLI